MPAHALARNPHLPAAKMLHDRAAEGSSEGLPRYPISPPEAWRVVRTRRYVAEGQRQPQSELVRHLHLRHRAGNLPRRGLPGGVPRAGVRRQRRGQPRPPAWAAALLEAVEKGTVARSQVDSVRRSVLKSHRGAKVRERAAKLFAAATSDARRYLNYVVTLADDRATSGIIAAESPTAITLRRADGQGETVLRSQIAELRSTKLSLMPEGLEEKITQAEMADLLAFLLEPK